MFLVEHNSDAALSFVVLVFFASTLSLICVVLGLPLVFVTLTQQHCSSCL
jgi:hypothetical protein